MKLLLLCKTFYSQFQNQDIHSSLDVQRDVRRRFDYNKGFNAVPLLILLLNYSVSVKDNFLIFIVWKKNIKKQCNLFFLFNNNNITKIITDKQNSQRRIQDVYSMAMMETINCDFCSNEDCYLILITVSINTTYIEQLDVYKYSKAVMVKH